MDQVHVVRHKVLVEAAPSGEWRGSSGSRVRGPEIPDRSDSRPQKRRRRGHGRSDAVRERVDTLLTESARWTGGKQRLTATRLHELLVAEGKHVGVTLVNRRHAGEEGVAEWKRRRREVFVPLTYRPGEFAEVDFFEVLVDVEGTRQKA